MKPGLYQHYKGNHYHVIGIGRHAETLEEVIIYRALYGDHGLWIRPKSLFLETILHEGKERPRFQFIRSMDIEAPAVR